MNNQCFKAVIGTEYDKAIKEHFELLPKWGNVFKKLNEYLGEELTRIAFLPDVLWIDKSELTKDENKKLFTNKGKVKSNLKKSKQLEEKYKEIIKEEGLENYKDLSRINFSFGFYRLRGQHMESFVTSENDIYYKADFDLRKGSDKYLEHITEIEYEEKYLEELKKNPKR